MAEKYSFFDSVNGDRRYPADEFAKYFRTLFKNGVFVNIDVDALKVSAVGSTMETQVSTGVAYLEGYRYESDAPIVLTHATADPTFERIDRIVVRLDKDLRKIETYIKAGVVGGTAPALERTEKIYELCLAEITITPGKSYIDNTQIQDTRLDLDLCGKAAPVDMANHAENHLPGGSDPLDVESLGIKTTFDDFYSDAFYIYVDAINGNDETGDGSEAAPFKTLDYTIDFVKKIRFGNLFIYLTYNNQNVPYIYNASSLSGMIGGHIHIEAYNQPVDAKVKVDIGSGIGIHGGSAMFTFDDLDLINGYSNAIQVSGANYVYLRGVRIADHNSLGVASGVEASQGAVIELNNCEISNVAYALRSNGGGIISEYQTTGTDIYTAYAASGGIIFSAFKNLTAEISEDKFQGGQIFTGSGG